MSNLTYVRGVSSDGIRKLNIISVQKANNISHVSGYFTKFGILSKSVLHLLIINPFYIGAGTAERPP